MNTQKIFPLIAVMLLTAAGCARVALEGGDKPIHIILDINVRVARELDNFFAFEDQRPATIPATNPTTAAARI